MKSLCRIIFAVILVLYSAADCDTDRYIISGDTYFPHSSLLKAVNGGSDNIESDINKILDLYTDKGFPFATVRIDSMSGTPGNIRIYLKIDSGRYTRVDSILFRGAEKTSCKSLRKLTGLKNGERFSDRKVREASRRLYLSGLFEEEPRFGLLVTGPSGTGIRYDVRERKYNQISFLGGYGSGEDERELNISADLSSDNLFGTMRALRMKWERRGILAEHINVYYREPFFFDIFLATEASYSQNYTKDRYLRRSYYLNQKYSPGVSYSFVYGYEQRYFFPEEQYLSVMSETVITGYNAGIEYRYGRLIGEIPTGTGFESVLKITSSQIRSKDGDMEGVEVYLEPVVMLQTGGNIFVKLRTEYRHAVYGQNVPESGRIMFGGASSFRGYREEFFLSDLMILNSLDVLYRVPGDSAAFSLFADVCSFNENYEPPEGFSDLSVLLSFGAGIVYRTDSGHISVQAAVPMREGFGESVVHLRYSFRF